jgi:hypothetical protein
MSLLRLWDWTARNEIAILEVQHAKKPDFERDDGLRSVITPGLNALQGDINTDQPLSPAARERDIAFPLPSGPINAGVFSASGALVATAFDDCTVRIWDAVTRLVTAELLGHTRPIRCLAFSADGRQLATASDDLSIRIWDVAAARESKKLSVEGVFHNLCFSPNELRLLATAWSHSTVFDLSSGDVVATFDAPFNEEIDLAEFTSDGLWILIYSHRAKLIRMSLDAELLHDDRPLSLPEMRGARLACSISCGSHSAVSKPITSSTAAEDTKGLVDCSVFARPRAAPGDRVLVQVFLHPPEDADRVEFLSRKIDQDASLRGIHTLNVEVTQDASIVIDLDGRGLKTEEFTQAIVWRGRSAACTFILEVPLSEVASAYYPVVRVIIDSCPVGRIIFKIDVDLGAKVVPAQLVGRSAEKYNYAFLSYASEDRVEVLKRIQTLRVAKIEFFQDLLSLQPGDRWESEIFRNIDRADLFLLFWSGAAQKSKWVIKEAEYALESQCKSKDKLPDIIPIILEGPPVVEPPDSLKNIHFNDTIQYLIAAEQAHGHSRSYSVWSRLVSLFQNRGQ